MTTTTTATRSQVRTEAPAPTGAAWEWFTAHQPQADQARIAGRWAAALALYDAGNVGQPDASGARQVRSSMADSPERQPSDPIAYTVHPVSVTPRQYECACPDYEWRRQQTGGFCKHILATWIALYYVCQQRQAVAAAEAITTATQAQPAATAEERIVAAVASLAHRNAEGLAQLLEAVAGNDAKAARTAAARLTGWPSRNRNRRPASAHTHHAITQLAA